MVENFPAYSLVLLRLAFFFFFVILSILTLGPSELRPPFTGPWALSSKKNYHLLP